MNQLRATFLMQPARLQMMIDTMDKRTGSPVDVKVYDVLSDPPVTRIEGLPQAVMHVIGEVAAHGEATLTGVVPC